MSKLFHHSPITTGLKITILNNILFSINYVMISYTVICILHSVLCVHIVTCSLVHNCHHLKWLEAGLEMGLQSPHLYLDRRSVCGSGLDWSALVLIPRTLGCDWSRRGGHCVLVGRLVTVSSAGTTGDHTLHHWPVATTLSLHNIFCWDQAWPQSHHTGIHFHSESLDAGQIKCRDIGNGANCPWLWKCVFQYSLHK